MTPQRSLAARAGGVLMMLVVAAFLAPPAMLAASRGASALVIDAPASVLFTKRIEVAVVLRDSSGRAIPDAVLGLAINGLDDSRRRTDSTGAATFSVSRNLAPGSYTFRVTFDGDAAFLPASATAGIVVEPPSITVKTLPPIAGAVFTYRGRNLTTGADGAATMILDALPEEDVVPTFVAVPDASGVETKFDRWWGKAPDLTASFDISYQVGLHFAHRLNETVPPEAITSVTLRSSIGEVIELTKIEPIWVHGVRVVSLAGGLEAKDILYGIDDVEVEGANVVNRAQQRFVPREARDWNVELLYYQTTIRLQDLLFGSPIKAAVTIEYPNGRLERRSTDSAGVLALPPLPRGTYKITPEGAGIKVTRPVTMSRDADVTLTVISYGDVALGLAIPALIAIVLLLVGRPHLSGLLRPWRWRPRRWRWRREPAAAGPGDGIR